MRSAEEFSGLATADLLALFVIKRCIFSPSPSPQVSPFTLSHCRQWDETQPTTYLGYLGGILRWSLAIGLLPTSFLGGGA